MPTFVFTVRITQLCAIVVCIELYRLQYVANKISEYTTFSDYSIFLLKQNCHASSLLARVHFNWEIFPNKCFVDVLNVREN